ncbi:MAG: hypothetical protein ACPLGZ_00965 [Candidatus Pelagibacter ubique]
MPPPIRSSVGTPPSFEALILLVPLSCKSSSLLPAALAVSVTFSFSPVNVVAELSHSKVVLKSLVPFNAPA